MARPDAFDPKLPIDAALPALLASMRAQPNAVLVAPPGAGKTTRVPLHLLDEPWAAPGRLILLEPRRLAARAAADRMAATMGERVGETVGLRVRLDTRVSARTRIEVVTAGVFTRQVLDDPELTGVAGVIFDEFHERSLDADLGLALALDAQAGLRPDLRLLVMSATLDGARVAGLLGDAPVIRSEGRAFPVETRHLPRDPARRIEDAVADAVLGALGSEPGSLLVFLPGAGEIRRVAAALGERVVDPAVVVAPLFGALDRAEQDRAVQPAPPGRRKVVLATSIAETSLTIEGVRVVIDSGLSRVPVYEPGIGLTRLVTRRASRAAADQRRGRAGRTEPGLCIRLWAEAATGALEPFDAPEILSADLSGFLLDCAEWGVVDPVRLPFLDPPPAAALVAARTMLVEIGAVDADGRITDPGRALRRLPLPPRLARAVLDGAAQGAGQEAAELAVLLVERGLGSDAVDLGERLDSFRRDRSRRAADARRLAEGWARVAASDGVFSLPAGEGGSERSSETGGGARSPERQRQRQPPPSGTAGLPPPPSGEEKRAPSLGRLAALAYPDRIAKARGRQGEFVMANGRGAALEPHSALARAPYLAIAEVAGAAGSGRILAAAAIDADEIEGVAAGRIDERTAVVFDPASRSLRARATRRFGALVLAERPMPVPRTAEAAAILARGAAALGLSSLPGSDAATQWRDRVAFLRALEGDPWPDLSDAALAATVEDWLAPHLLGKGSLADLAPDELRIAVEALLPWEQRVRLDAEAPTHLVAPTGSRIPIDYAAEGGPVASVRVQELFGLARHPAVAGGRTPIVLHLLSPASRPIQVTRDLPAFWRGSWAEVRSAMRGRYPRHPWPEDPAAAEPTRRAKPSGA